MTPHPVPPPSPARSDQEDVTLPLYGASPRQAVVRFWRKYAVFSGRASRSEYWWWTLVAMIISTVLQLATAVLSPEGINAYFLKDRNLWDQGLLSWLWTAATLVPGLALVVRRLHDGNRSGWWLLLLLPLYAALVLQTVVLARLDVVSMTEQGEASQVLLALVPGLVLTLVGLVGAIVLLVFLITGPDPRGVRFDRHPFPADPRTGLPTGGR